MTFISSIPSESPCAAGGNSWLYQISLCSGGKTASPQFDTNEDHLYINDSTGNINPVLIPYSGEGVLYWRLIR